MPHAPHAFQKRRLGGSMSVGQLLIRDAEAVAIEPDAVELLGVTQHRLQTAAAHIRADALDDTRRRQRLAEHLEGQFAAPRRDEFFLGAQLGTKRGELLLAVRARTVDPPEVQASHRKALEVHLWWSRGDNFPCPTRAG